jgi:hypothetical protein
MSANTTPHNITYPVSTDGVAPLETVFATMASSIESAMTAQDALRQIPAYLWTNTAGRTGQAGMVNGSTGYQQDTGTSYVYDGTTWQPYNSGWQAWTPTYTGFVLGAGSNDEARWRYSGGMVEYELAITFGTGMSVATASTVNPPVPMSALIAQNQLVGHNIANIASTLYWSATVCAIPSGTRLLQPMRTGTGGAGGGLGAVSATQPNTWVSGSHLIMSGRYAI